MLLSGEGISVDGSLSKAICIFTKFGTRQYELDVIRESMFMYTINPRLLSVQIILTPACIRTRRLCGTQLLLEHVKIVSFLFILWRLSTLSMAILLAMLW